MHTTGQLLIALTTHVSMMYNHFTRREFLRSGSMGIAGVVGGSGIVTGQQQNYIRLESLVSQSQPGNISWYNTNYKFKVSGEIKDEGINDPNDYVASGGGEAWGRLQEIPDFDEYHFTGKIIEFSHSNPLKIMINGKEIDPRWLGSASSMGGSDLPNKISISTNDQTSVDYAFAVDGVIKKTTPPDGDVLSGSTVVGSVSKSRDNYKFSGNVTSFWHNGASESMNIKINDEAIDNPHWLGSDGNMDYGSLPREISVSTNGQTSIDYAFAADGVIKSVVPSGSDTVSTSTVVGSVNEQRDDYKFSGDVTSFWHNGTSESTEVEIDGNPVNPDCIGESPVCHLGYLPRSPAAYFTALAAGTATIIGSSYKLISSVPKSQLKSKLSKFQKVERKMKNSRGR